MHAKYYKRKRDTPYEDKPVIQAIFALKANADTQGLAIKTLYVTGDEFGQLETEIRALAADVNFYKLKDPAKGIANFIGLPFEVLDTIEGNLHRKVDKAS